MLQEDEAMPTRRKRDWTLMSIAPIPGGRQWEVLHVRPRAEKKVDEFCEANNIAAYLPLRSEMKIYQRRKVIVRKPVFPGYMFAAFNREERALILKTNNVVRTLAAESEAQLIHELEQVRLALMADPTLTACIALKTGTRVLIRQGVFMGIEGVVARLRSVSKVRLNVEVLGQAVHLEIAREFLEVIE